MEFIVFDLEWNMGYQPYSFSYEGFPVTLRGEIIQIGAVRINEAGQVLDSYHANLKPRIFRRLHHQITKVTGLTQQVLNAGDPVQVGLSRFVSWCGTDAPLLTWGPDDIGVLKQNLFLNNLPVAGWPCAFYDLQRIYTAQHPRTEGEGMTLEAVTERLGIAPDGTFHDAFADAKCTAAICAHLDMARGIAEYESIDALLRSALVTTESEAAMTGFTRFGQFANRDAWDEMTAIQQVPCPECGAPLLPDADGIYVKKGNHGRSMLCQCPAHGPLLVHWKRMQQDGLHWDFARVTQTPTEAQTEQWLKKKKIQLAAVRRRQQAEAAEKG